MRAGAVMPLSWAAVGVGVLARMVRSATTPDSIPASAA